MTEPKRFTMEDFVVYAIGSCAVIAGCGVALALVIAAITHAVSYAACEISPETPRCVAIAKRDAKEWARLP